MSTLKKNTHRIEKQSNEVILLSKTLVYIINTGCMVQRGVETVLQLMKVVHLV